MLRSVDTHDPSEPSLGTEGVAGTRGRPVPPGDRRSVPETGFIQVRSHRELPVFSNGLPKLLSTRSYDDTK